MAEEEHEDIDELIRQLENMTPEEIISHEIEFDGSDESREKITKLVRQRIGQMAKAGMTKDFYEKVMSGVPKTYIMDMADRALNDWAQMLFKQLMNIGEVLANSGGLNTIVMKLAQQNAMVGSSLGAHKSFVSFNEHLAAWLEEVVEDHIRQALSDNEEPE